MYYSVHFPMLFNLVPRLFTGLLSLSLFSTSVSLEQEQRKNKDIGATSHDALGTAYPGIKRM